MKRHLLLGIGLMVGLGLLALRVAAQERAGEAGQAQIATQALNDLRPKLAEFQSGKRDDRDGYIIIRLMLNNLDALRQTDSTEAPGLKGELNRLLKKHPTFASLNDSRLSEELAASKLRQEQANAVATTAFNWVPPDRVPLAYYASGKRLAVRYQFRIDFIHLADDVSLQEISSHKLKLLRQTADASSNISLEELHPASVMTFKRQFEVLPRNVEHEVQTPLLVCTNALDSAYGPMTTEEERMVRARGGQYSIPWINHNGQHEDFCGVIAVDGRIIFKIPITQRSPDRLFDPVGISQNRAAVAVGEKLPVSTEDGEYSRPGNFREIVIWEAPGKIKRLPVNPEEKFRQPLEKKFRDGGL